VVAAALGATALVLVVTLRGSLVDSAGAQALERAQATLPYLGDLSDQTLAGDQALAGGPTETGRTVEDGGKPATGQEPAGGRSVEGGRKSVTGQEPVGGPTEAARTLEAGGKPEGGQDLEGGQPGKTGEPAAAGAGGDARVGAARLGPGPTVGTGFMPTRGMDVMVTKDATDAKASWAMPGRYAVAYLKVPTADGPVTVWARASLEGVQRALGSLKNVLLPGVPALLLIVAGMTWFSVGRALAPVAAIRAKVADITARDLHQRVPVPRSRDEIAALATTVNATIDRLETAVETHTRFVADAAHELRSPIATLRTRMELAPASELTREALADLTRLQSLAADLLLLAKLDAGEPLLAGDVDLGQVAAEESLRLVRPPSGRATPEAGGPAATSARHRPEVRLLLDVEPDVVLPGSAGHLGRLVTNLVDNAVRHARTTVRVRVHRDGDTAVLEVLDDGPGIPVEHREAVFDRFTRLDEARARDAGGAGLGLSIARDIAALHQGTLVAEDGGLVARFPSALGAANDDVRPANDDLRPDVDAGPDVDRARDADRASGGGQTAVSKLIAL
jgi:signal transduction histidine kinase